MPRKRRSSNRSSFSNKSPRKLNLNASLEEGDILTGESGKQLEPVTFFFEEEEELTWSNLEAIELVSAGEETENENKQPSEKEESNYCPIISVSSPAVKRAFPLSPTLLDNVVQTPQSGAVPTAVPSDDPVETPDNTSKIEDESNSTFNNRKSGRTRRIFSPTKIKIFEKQPLVLKKNENVKNEENKLNKATTSQQPSTSDKTEPPVAVFKTLDDYFISEAPPEDPYNYRKWIEKSKEELCKEVAYELDEEDICWLNIVNKTRTERSDGLNLGGVECEEMELLLDRFEKQNYFDLQNAGMGQPGESDEDAVCCICLDGESDNSNLIIFCDMCNIPVHQDCFGVPFIPEGIWLCRRCSICPNVDIECIFCPNKDGAFKSTVDGRWAHVLCALWIPEVRFANPSLVEPVDDIDDIPRARWNLTCFLCKKKGACIQCHLRSCSTAFHATCAQAAGLSLKILTRESTGVRMAASCDKHTLASDMDALKQKIETIHKVLSEKRSASSEFQSISADRIASISELVNFPGKLMFSKRLYAYWRLKRKSRGGAPLLRNVESLWFNVQEPPAPPKMVREVDENAWVDYEKMLSLKTDLTTVRKFCEMIKSHGELEREDVELRRKIESIKLEAFCSSEVHVYLNILSKLGTKDKFRTFAEPVCGDDAPDYFNVISAPMDLSTMREKVLKLEYSTIDELEDDFNLMISNCMTYNKKSTPYYKDAVRMKEFGCQVFQDARIELEKKAVETEAALEMKPDCSNQMTNGDCDTELNNSVSLQVVLISLVEQLARNDKDGIFAEPVDIKYSPDYMDIIENPMDFSTMKNKIYTNQYSSIEDLEKDFLLMINNCLEYNEEKTKFYKIAKQMSEVGKDIFNEVKQKNLTAHLPFICNKENNNYKTERDALLETQLSPEISEQDMVHIMTDVVDKLIATDDEEIFMEPVTEDLAPGYSEIIKCPMDLSLIKENLTSSLYKSLDEIERDFALMIDNCKKYNSPGTKYYNYAIKIKRAGNTIFNTARKRIGTNKLSKVGQ